MIHRIAISVFILLCASLLILQRFDSPKTITPTLIASSNSTLAINQTFRRGETLETKKEETLLLQIGNNRVGLDQNTTIIFQDLNAAAPILKFTRGRIYVDARGDKPLFVDTNYIENIIQKSSATLVNFDFLEKVQIIPLEGYVQTTVKNSNESMLLPVAMEIKETPPAEYHAIEFNRMAAKNFYDWIDAEINVR